MFDTIFKDYIILNIRGISVLALLFSDMKQKMCAFPFVNIKMLASILHHSEIMKTEKK